MTLEPLMLSDTAMVLLREYIEVDISWSLLIKSHEKNADRREIYDRDTSFSYRRDLQEALIDEIGYLWISQDIPLIRHLDWHLTLNHHLMVEAEKTLSDGDRYLIYRAALGLRYGFMRKLSQAYQDMLETLSL